MQPLTTAFLLSLCLGCVLPSGHTDDSHPTLGEEANTLPIFDAHMHWKQPAWEPFPPDVVVSMMDKNGVAMALVSSTPDEGTIRLWEYAPERFVPEMRPYNEQWGSRNWTKGEGVGDYIEQRVREYPHQGIGEFHLHRVDVEDQPLLKRIVALALEKDIPLHVHSGYHPVNYLYSLDPRLTIIWAHAGMSDPPAIINEMMNRYDTLYADTSFRELDILTGEGGIEPEWKTLLEQHADRFMVGSDTWVNAQWLDYDELIAQNRQWLAHLSPEAAHKIAYQNAAELFNRSLTPAFTKPR